MEISKRTLVVCAALIPACCSHVAAQQDHDPKIVIAHRGCKTLTEDLTQIMKLTSEKEQKQLDAVLGQIEMQFWGVNPDRPLRVDVLTGFSPPAYIVWGAYEVLDMLRVENMGEAYPMRPVSNNLYKLTRDTGWFRIVSDLKYTALIISPDKADENLLKQIVVKQPDPTPGIDRLLGEEAHLAFLLSNNATTESDLAERRQSLNEIRTNKMAAVRKRPDESKSGFELRKASLQNKIDELERLLVETANASLRFALDRSDVSARIWFEATAIDDTSLASSLSQFGQQPDVFASVVSPDDSVLSVRANHSIDQLRQERGLTFIHLLKADVAARLASDEKRSEDQKNATGIIVEEILTIAADGIRSGNINAYLDTVIRDEENFVSIAGISVADGTRLKDVLAMIPDAADGNQVTLNSSAVNGVEIHEVQLAEGFFPQLDRLRNPNRKLFVGTSDQTVWVGVGAGSRELMESAIANLQAPVAGDTALAVKAKLQPWIQRTLSLVQKQKLADRKQERQRRELQRSLQLADGALKPDDEARFTMRVSDGTASGEIFVSTGILKYLGREISWFFKNNM